MKYRAEVDGLRALAVIPVIFFHADFSLFAGGYIGVDIFFVISGYLITSIIIAELDKGKFSIVNFYERRARRILPALFFVMLVCIPLSWTLLISTDMKSFSQSLVAVSVFGSNVLFWLTSGYFESASELKPLLHTWSLAIEEQFYVIFPLLLFFLWGLGKKPLVALLIALAGASLAAAQWGAVRNPDATFYLLHTRAWELLVGSFIAFYFARHGRNSKPLLAEFASLLGLGMIVFSMFTFDATTPFPSLYALLPVVGTALIIIFASPDNLVGRLFCHKLLVGIGIISYSAYLWHQPLFAFARHKQMADPSVATYLALSIISLGLAYLSWKYIEAPFRNKKRVTRKAIFTFSFAGSLFFIVVGLIGHKTEGKFFRHYDSTQQRLIATMNQRGANAGCWRALERGLFDSPACVLGEPTQPPSFALLGDSHAGALAPTLNDFAALNGISGLNYTYTTCVPIFDLTPVVVSNRAQHCLNIREHYEQLLKAGQLPENLIIAARWSIYLSPEPFNNQEGGREPHGHVLWTMAGEVYTDNEHRLQQAIFDTIELMQANGHRVFVVDPSPEMGWDVPARLKKLYGINNQLQEFDASTSQRVYLNRNQLIIDTLDRLPESADVIRIRPADAFCKKGRCLGHVENIPLYYDRDHISVEGADLILREKLSPMLGR